MNTDSRLFQDEKWFVVQNGNQVDIHARVFPPNQESREVVVLDNLDEADARRTVNEHNAMIAERRRDGMNALAESIGQ